MDFYGAQIVIKEDVMCIDEEFNNSWDSSKHIQSWIKALNESHEILNGDNKGENMDVFEEVQLGVAKALREDEDRKIKYLMTGEIPDEFKCPNCPDSSKREDFNVKPLPAPYLPECKDKDPDAYGKFIRLH